MVKDSIRDFIYRTFPLAKSREITDATALLEDGVLDSLGILELVTFLQDEIGVGVEDDELLPENFTSIDAIASFVASKLGSVNQAS